MSEKTDEVIESLVATGILIAIGYGIYRLLKSSGDPEPEEKVSKGEVLQQASNKLSNEKEPAAIVNSFLSQTYQRPRSRGSSDERQLITMDCSNCGQGNSFVSGFGTPNCSSCGDPL